jgi:hypothetical protein
MRRSTWPQPLHVGPLTPAPSSGLLPCCRTLQAVRPGPPYQVVDREPPWRDGRDATESAICPLGCSADNRQRTQTIPVAALDSRRCGIAGSDRPVGQRQPTHGTWIARPGDAAHAHVAQGVRRPVGRILSEGAATVGGREHALFPPGGSALEGRRTRQGETPYLLERLAGREPIRYRDHDLLGR